MKKILALCGFLFSGSAFSAAVTAGVNVFSYAGTNVTTSAYTTLVAATPYNVSKIQVCDTSTKLLKIAVGAASSEVDAFTVNVSGCVLVPFAIAAGSRLSIEAIDATATVGYNSLSFLP